MKMGTPRLALETILDTKYIAPICLKVIFSFNFNFIRGGCAILTLKFWQKNFSISKTKKIQKILKFLGKKIDKICPNKITQTL